MRKGLLIPVKQLSQAKRRLAPHFAAQDRAELADALWQDFFQVAAAVRALDQVFVVSAEARVLDRARELGWVAIPESEQTSESHSVDLASQICAQSGIETLLRLPVDLPLVEPRDIEAMFKDVPASPAAVLTPSRDGDGTNALLRTPPALFPSRFGPGSFAKHLAEAAQCGARTKVLRNPRLEIDLDDLEDLRVAAEYALRPSLTRAWLQSQGFIRATTRRRGPLALR